MKNSKLVLQIAGKLVVEGLTPEVVTKEKAFQKTAKGTLTVLMHLTIEQQYDDIVAEMAQMTLN